MIETCTNGSATDPDFFRGIQTRRHFKILAEEASQVTLHVPRQRNQKLERPMCALPA